MSAPAQRAADRSCEDAVQLSLGWIELEEYRDCVAAIIDAEFADVLAEKDTIIDQCRSMIQKGLADRDRLAAENAELERDAKRLDWWEKHRNVSIGYDPDDESSKDFVLYRETGSVNDREWSVIARGHSLRAAIDSALEPPC